MSGGFGYGDGIYAFIKNKEILEWLKKEVMKSQEKSFDEKFKFQDKNEFPLTQSEFCPIGSTTANDVNMIIKRQFPCSPNHCLTSEGQCVPLIFSDGRLMCPQKTHEQ